MKQYVVCYELSKIYLNEIKRGAGGNIISVCFSAESSDMKVTKSLTGYLLTLGKRCGQRPERKFNFSPYISRFFK